MAVELRDLGGSSVLSSKHADVGMARESARRRRYYSFSAFLLPICAFLVYRLASGRPIHGFPHIPWDKPFVFPVVLLFVLILSILLPYIAMGKSPHVLFRPEEIPVGLDDVVGAEIVKEEVIKSLNLFLAYKTFKERMGGNPRRAILFEGPPGTGKTYMAKAMAREAGVPFFLFPHRHSNHSFTVQRTARSEAISRFYAKPLVRMAAPLVLLRKSMQSVLRVTGWAVHR